MSTRRSKANNTASALTGFVVLHVGERKILHKISSYDDVLAKVIREAPEMGSDPDGLVLGTYELPFAKGQLVEIPRSEFDAVIPHLTQLHISEKVQYCSSTEEDSDEENFEPKVSRCPSTSADNSITVYIVGSYGEWPVTMSLEGTVAALKAQFYSLSDIIPMNDIRLIFDGIVLFDSNTLADYNMEEGDTIHLHATLKGGKPVIYLFPPSSLDTTVEITLVSEWEFSAVYPVVPVKQEHKGQTVTWSTQCDANGTMVEKSTNLEVTYLFWEAETTIPRPLTPPSSPLQILDDGQELFCPINSNLNNDNSVLLAIAELPKYLDSCLKALSLHTEARTSFITYWLPAFLKHKYIALRFIPQSLYERAAPLTVTPVPDIVTRVFMLFRGIAEENVDDSWASAVARTNEDVTRWVGVVGVDLEKASNTSLFRVLEWGGMEKKLIGLCKSS